MSQGKQMYYHYLRENIRNMHPKFKELAIQAGAYEDNGTILTGPMDTAKFAELIVQECLDMCKRVKDDCEWRGKEFDIDQMQRQIGVNLCVREIKQNFDLQ